MIISRVSLPLIPIGRGVAEDGFEEKIENLPSAQFSFCVTDVVHQIVESVSGPRVVRLASAWTLFRQRTFSLRTRCFPECAVGATQRSPTSECPRHSPLDLVNAYHLLSTGTHCVLLQRWDLRTLSAQLWTFALRETSRVTSAISVLGLADENSGTCSVFSNAFKNNLSSFIRNKGLEVSSTQQ